MAINHEVLNNRVNRLVEEGLYRFGDNFEMLIQFLSKKAQEAAQAAKSQFDKKRKLAFALLSRAITERVTGYVSKNVIESINATINRI